MRQTHHLKIVSPQLGYQIAQTDEAVKEAIQSAFDLARKSRHAGGEIRIWSEKATLETKVLLQSLQSFAKKPSVNEDIGMEKHIWALASWENQILQTLRTYVTETTTLLNQAKQLNPPLTSAQLKPFIDAMTTDRHVTMASLDGLTKNIEQMGRLKARFHNPISPFFSYKPSV